MTLVPSTADAQEALAEAERLAAQKATEYQQKLTKHAYGWAYGQTWSALDQIAANPTVAAIRRTGDAAIALGKTGQALYQDFKKGVTDAGGVVDASKAVASFATSFGTLLQRAGVRNQVVQGIVDWVGVGAGCAASIGGGAAAGGGAPGAIVGGIACAFSVISRLFSSEDVFYLANTEPRSIFTPNDESQPLVAADAVRLATVLRHYYGVTSYKSLVERLNVPRDEFRWLLDLSHYPPSPPKGEGKVDRPAAHNMRTITQMLALEKNATNANINTRAGLAVLAGYRSGLEFSGRGLMRRYAWDHDVNVAAIENGAYFARGAIAAHGKPEIVAQVVMGHDVLGWENLDKSHITPVINLGGVGMPFHALHRGVTVDYASFLRASELINFFAGVSAVEMSRQMPTRERYSFGHYNPVRFSFVADGDRSGQKPGEFSTRCWTNLRRAGMTSCGNDVLTALNTVSPLPAALKEFGAMRLMAAFSYIHMAWMWSEFHVDMIADIAPNLTEEDLYLRSPIDPRQASTNGSTWRLEGPDAWSNSALVRFRPERRNGPPNSFSMTRFLTDIVAVKPVVDYVPSLAGPQFIYNQAQIRENIAKQALAAARTRANTQILRISSGFESILHGKTANQAMHTVLTDPRWSAQLRSNLLMRIQPTSSNLGPVLLAGAAGLLALKLLR